MAGDARWVNVTELFTKGAMHYMRPLADAFPEQAETFLDRLNQLRQMTEREFHQEEITGADKDVEEVVGIFNRVNSGGTKLSKGDLALAKVCVQWPDARRVMRAAIDRWHERGYKFTLDWLLRTTMAVATGKARFDDRAHRDKVLYWYMHSALWGRYNGPTGSTLQRDFDTAERSGVDGLIKALERSRSGSLKVRPHDFEGTQGSRFYPLLYLLVRARGSRDLATGQELTAEALGSHSQLRRHTLFPTSLLRGREAKADAIANFCFLTERNDLEVGQLAPHEYLAEAEAAHPGVLASQRIPADSALWRPERYRDFLAARRELLAEAAQSFLEGLRRGTAPEERELRPLTVTAEETVGPRGAQVRALVGEMREAEYAEPELGTAINDPERGGVIAEAEAFWPDGLQHGVGRPVVLELDPERADLPRLQELGYEVFTSVDSLTGFVRRLGQDSAGEHPVAEPVPEDVTEEGFAEAADPDTSAFGEAMVSVYERAKTEAGYTASFFLGMLSELGPLGTARRLLHAPAVSDGFSNLWERGRLDLTVEALVLRPEFAPLFTEEELGRARSRLEQFGHRFLDAG